MIFSIPKSTYGYKNLLISTIKNGVLFSIVLSIFMMDVPTLKAQDNSNDIVELNLDTLQKNQEVVLTDSEIQAVLKSDDFKSFIQPIQVDEVVGRKVYFLRPVEGDYHLINRLFANAFQKKEILKIEPADNGFKILVNRKYDLNELLLEAQRQGVFLINVNTDISHIVLTDTELKKVIDKSSNLKEGLLSNDAISDKQADEIIELLTPNSEFRDTHDKEIRASQVLASRLLEYDKNLLSNVRSLGSSDRQQFLFENLQGYLVNMVFKLYLEGELRTTESLEDIKIEELERKLIEKNPSEIILPYLHFISKNSQVSFYN